MYNPYAQMTSNNMYYYVNGIEGARSFPLAPNQTALLMDNDNPMLYVKSTNQMGQATIKTFKLQEMKSNPLPEAEAFEKIEERLRLIEEKIGGIDNEQSNI